MQVSREMLIRIGGGLAIVLVLYFLLRSTNKSSGPSDYDNKYSSARFEHYAPYPEDEYDASMEAGDEQADEEYNGEEDQGVDAPEEEGYAEYNQMEETMMEEEEPQNDYYETPQEEYPMAQEDDEYAAPQEEDSEEEDSEEEEEDSEGMADYGTAMYDDATPVRGFNAYEEFTVLESTMDDGMANGMFATPM